MDPKFLLTIIIRLALAVVALVLLLRLIENRLVFYPQKIPSGTPLPSLPGFPFEECWIQTSDHVRLNGWFIAQTGNPDWAHTYLLYLHGNGGSLFGREDRLALLAEQHLRILAIDYRGYGKSEGKPDEEGVYRDASAAYEWLIRQQGVDPRSLILFGESLGSAVAIELALSHPCAGIILEAPFTSFVDMGKIAIPFLPRFIYRFLKNDWNSIGRIGRIDVPKFIMHGDRDRVIPFAQGQRLFESAREPKSFYRIPGADHLESFDRGGPALMDRLNEFIRTATLPAQDSGR